MENNIKIWTKSKYLPEKSNEQQGFFLFSYRIKIKNNSQKVVQLISRYWSIKDGEGRIEDVYGPGVVGKKPRLYSQGFFEYTSFCLLTTPIGFMRGHYRLASSSGAEFNVKIKMFRLAANRVLN